MECLNKIINKDVLNSVMKDSPIIYFNFNEYQKDQIDKNDDYLKTFKLLKETEKLLQEPMDRAIKGQSDQQCLEFYIMQK